MDNLFVSSGAFESDSLAEIIALCGEHGFDRLELSSGTRHAADQLTPVRAARQIRYLVHNYFPPPAVPFVLNLASTDAPTLDRSLTMCRTGIDLAAEFGAPFYSVHSGFALNLTPELLGNPSAQADVSARQRIPRDEALAVFQRSVRDLATYARSRGVRLLLENNVISPLHLKKHGTNPLLLCDAVEIASFFRDLDDATVGLLVDVGHAKVSATALGFAPAEFLLEVAPHIAAWHLSDNDGVADQNYGFDEKAWFFPQVRKHADVPIVLEVYRLAPEQIRAQQTVVQRALN